MKKLLYRIRIMLAGASIVISVADIEADDYASYTALVLLALLIIRAGTLLPRLTRLLLLIELISFAWFSYTYGGVLFLLLFSTLIAIFQTGPARLTGIAWSAFGLGMLITGMHGSGHVTLVAVIVLWASTAAILYAANELNDKRHRMEDLYEALAASHEELDAARRRMLEYASQIGQYAQTEERNRIAKDIHDDLGHRLIRVKMMSEAALRLFDADTDRARSTVEQIRDQLQDSMERMRRTVRRLSDDDERDSRKYALDKLVQESADGLGIQVSFEVRGIPRSLYPSMELILFKNAQEAITNAIRHGHATIVEIELRYDESSVSLTIANNGAIPEGPVEAGLGMRGMKERIALVGGRLEWQLTDRFSVTTTLPLLGI
ncbi:sensor histidine kinase [Paenibacillus harenae]|uniref:sensor histidine kinase n=1 Tax=Paenibacillus harenae TaxID=306543 RepID=UPI000413F1ED|nr:sensor histidine kinase [Paenibacillus harenae]